MPTSTTPTSTTWKPHALGHAWSDADDWTHGVPTADDYARIVGDLSLQLRLSRVGLAVGRLTLAQASVTLYSGSLTFSSSPASRIDDDLVLNGAASLTVDPGATLSGEKTMVVGADGSAARLNVLGTVREEFAVVRAGQLTIAHAGRWVPGASGLAVGGASGAQLLVFGGGVIDGGADAAKDPAQGLYLGEGDGTGGAEVTGAGSRISLTSVWVGENGEGRLDIANGGVVEDEVGVIALDGDGYVTVSGAGSRWDNFAALTVGEVYPTDSRLEIVDNGQVDWGAGGFHLNDRLLLDGSASLGGQTIFDGGEIVALPGHGAVYLEQDIDIESNWLFEGRDLAAFSTTGAATLTLDGQIRGDAESILYVGAGNVSVTNAGNAFGETEIYGGVLEVWATGALGQGAVNFVGGAATHAEVVVLEGAAFGNLIENFGATDRLALTDFGFNTTISKTWAENATKTAGTLTLDNGSQTLALQFAGVYRASEFHLSEDLGFGVFVTVAGKG